MSLCDPVLHRGCTVDHALRMVRHHVVDHGCEAAVADTELGRQLRAPRSATEAARSSAEVLATVNERSHGVWMAFSEASRNDDVLSAELRRLTEEIAEQARIALGQWRTHGWLREDLPVAELVRRAAAIGSVELWDRLVRVEGHTREAYRELVAGLLVDALTSVRARADEFPVADGSH